MNPVALKEANEIVITTEQVEIIKQTVCKEATDAEMQLYFYDCKRRGVHPLDRLLHFTKRGGRYVPITSIDFLYQRAHATGQFAGQDETVFTGQPGTVQFEARVRVYRQRPGGEKAGWSAMARWSEYFPGDQQGHMWKKMPSRMLEKCCEALALRKAFPAELQGLYVPEELEQAENPPPEPQETRTARAAPRDKGQAVLSKLQSSSASVPAAPVAPTAPSAHPESAPGPVTGSAAGGDVEAEWLSGVLDCEEVLRGTTQGTGILRSIRAGFKLADGAYPLLPVQQEEYRVMLVKAVERMQGR